jgi:chlorite dismutase
MRPEKKTNIDLSEKGFSEKGDPLALDKRLFMQFLAFGGCKDNSAIIGALGQEKIEGVLYQDIDDPQGIGLLTFSEDPAFFVTKLRQVLNTPPFSSLTHKPEYSMFGRTYSLGHERNLEDWLLRRPGRVVSDHSHTWAIWYPLRRSGTFATLSQEEQRGILMEHGAIGRSYGEAGLAQDIRLATYGLNKNDNDFVIGLIGKELFPLSALVQAMRKTKQTSTYIQNMGPFFIGKAFWQSSHQNY